MMSSICLQMATLISLADQKGKKYKYKQLQQLLLDSYNKPFDEQKNVVAKSINDWKGNLEQVDDILLLGYKII